MTKQTKHSVYAFIGLTVSSVLLAGCVIHVGASDNDGRYSYQDERSLNTSNKSVSVAEGLVVADVSSVNGSVTIKDNVEAQDVSNVNGSIRIGDKVSVASIESVNGSVKTGDHFTASGAVETVNGSIRIEDNSSIAASIETVNGNITLENVSVGQNVVTINGNVHLLDETIIKGDVIFQGKPNNNNTWNKRPPTLKIDADSNIQGKIIVYKEVDFDFANKALMNKVERR
jgi:acyl-[acyl carrier protein]--UDP-N-acetylglucosamine O-acyltransferase